MRVLGADVAAGAWVGVVLDDDRPGAVEALTAPSVAPLVAAAGRGGPLAVVGLDIPVGLPEAGARRADALARRLVGARASSVFPVPVRAALEADDHAEAVRRSVALTGRGISAQSFALRHKVLEVDRWWRAAPAGGPRLVEVHPEVSFAAMAGRPLAHRKKSWAGALERWSLLAGEGVELRGDGGAAGAVAAVDDLLDAAAVAWSARRVARGLATSHPDPPETTPDGWPAAIWA